ncbi:MAG: cytochrome c [Planctomycetota bacterium]
MLAAITVAGVGCERSASYGVSAPVNQLKRGEGVYASSCLVCHQHDGSGVPGFQPPLQGSSIVAGDPDRLLEVVIRGSAALPEGYASPDGEDYAAEMPGFVALEDDDLAALLTYIRATWSYEGPVTPGQVRRGRAKLASDEPRPAE